MRRAASLVVLLPLIACGGSVAHTQSAKSAARQPARAPAPASQAVPATNAVQPAAPSEPGTPAAQAVPDVLTSATLAAISGIAPAATLPGPPPQVIPAAPALPQRLDGGEIPRTTLLSVLSDGIGRFLQKVRAEPHLVRGRFVGWRLVSLFDGEPAIA